MVDDIDTLLGARITKATISATGDLIYASAPNTPARLAAGATGQVLTIAAGAPSWANSPAPGYATTLPGSPTDGQEAVLVDSLTAPTYRWRFRYNAGSISTFKWEYVGGTPLRAHVAAAETTTGAGYADVATLTSVTVPRAGEYEVEHGCELSNNTAGTYSYASVKLGAAATSAADRAVAYQGAVNEANTVFTRLSDPKTLAAGDVVKQQYGASAGTLTVNNRNLLIIPVRVA